MLFILTDKLQLNLDYILGYKDLKDVYIEYKDQGIDKVESVFKYIFEVADPRSYSNRNAFDDIEKHTRGLVYANLESLKVTKTLNKAIKFYESYRYNIEADLLKDLKDNLKLSIKTNKHINKSLDDKLNSQTLSDADISAIITLQGKIFDLIEQLPSKIEAIKKLEVKVYESYTRPAEKARGDKPIPSSFEGDPDIEGEL
jgi:hypothetical protein